MDYSCVAKSEKKSKDMEGGNGPLEPGSRVSVREEKPTERVQ